MNLHKLLSDREQEGRPIRVGLIGAGRYGTMYLAQAQHISGMHVVADRGHQRQTSGRRLALVDWPTEQIAPDIAHRPHGSHHRDRAPTRTQLFDLDIDVIVEATGNPIVGVEACSARH